MRQFPLLQTKLHIPPVRPELVRRPRLIQRLNAGLDRRLTLVCAPAGFGKTTLVSEWVRNAGRPVAWLSLDVGDNDFARLVTHLIAALQRVKPGFGEAVLAVFQAKGIPLSHTELAVTAVAAGPEEACLLNVDQGEPLLRLDGVTYAQEGDPFPVAVLHQLHVGRLTSWAMRVTPPSHD